jgi:RNA polymerase sigma factor (sigma-70 family)
MLDRRQEKELITRAQNNPEAFGKIFDMYYRPILGYTVRRTANIEIARDITSEVFLKAFKNIHSFRWRGVSISSWLYRIASNEIISYFRKNKYHPDSLDELYEVAGFDPAEQKELQEEIIQAEEELERNKEFIKIQKVLTSLPTHYQEVIALRYFESKTIKEISAILNKKEGTVKSLLSRGIILLRDKSQEVTNAT